MAGGGPLVGGGKPGGGTVMGSPTKNNFNCHHLQTFVFIVLPSKMNEPGNKVKTSTHWVEG